MKLYDQPNTRLGVLFNIGDINGDGFDDFGQSGFYNNNGFATGIIYVFYGSKEFDTIPDWSLMSNCIDGLLGGSASGGDINGDGIDDLVVGEPYNWCDGMGRAYLFLGGDTLSDNPDVIFESGISGDLFSDNVNLNGDINSDGFNDLIIVAPFRSMGINARTYFYFGDSTISSYSDLEIDLHSSSSPVRTFILPDFNGDGINDLFISSVSNKLYFGSSEFDTTNYLIMPEEGIACIGDINNDGYSDLLLSDSYYRNSAGIMVGDAEIYLGSNNPDTTMDYFLEGETKWSGFGRGSTLGDINGDGYDEFFIIARYYPSVGNPLGKLYVYSIKKFLVDVNDENEQYPKKFSLSQNYPNPFNPTTTISYSIPEVNASPATAGGATLQSVDLLVQLKVYNILGREVATLVNQRQAPGNYSVQFNANNLPSGIYFYRLQVGVFSQTRKMVLMK
jgi:hypothetical protein